MSSLLHLHIATTTSRKVAARADDDYDEDDISELEDAIGACESIFSVLPAIFPPDTGDTEEFSLYHDDISSNNILVDPMTHCITGIVDWECVSLQPSWKVARVPQLLYGPEVDHGSPIRASAPAPDENADEFHKGLRDGLEQVLLRRIFYEGLGGKPDHGSRERLFENKMYQVEVRPRAVRSWRAEFNRAWILSLRRRMGIRISGPSIERMHWVFLERYIRGSKISIKRLNSRACRASTNIVVYDFTTLRSYLDPIKDIQKRVD